MYCNQPGDCIFCYYSSFDDTLCDQVVKFIDENLHQFKKEQRRRTVDKEQIYVNSDASHQLLQNFHESLEAAILENKISSVYKNITDNINLILPIAIPVNIDSGYNLRKFEAGEKTRFHLDGIDLTKDYSARTLTAITYLNDNFSGGELNFPNQNITITPQKGMTVLFPPYWTHPHCANPVDAPRYTVNTWYREVMRGQ